MAATRGDLTPDPELAHALYEHWRGEVGSGVPGYVTPKVGVGAVVFNDRDELLLIERPTHHWLYPTGWADVGYAPAEVAVKEVLEETGLHVTPLRLIAVYDIRHLFEVNMAQHLLLADFLLPSGWRRAHASTARGVGRGLFCPGCSPDAIGSRRARVD